MKFARLGVTVVLLTASGATGCLDTDAGETQELRFPETGEFGGPPPSGGDPNWGVTYYYVVMHVSEELADEIEANRASVEDAASSLIGISSYCPYRPSGERYDDSVSERLIRSLPSSWHLTASDVDVLHSHCMNNAGGITETWPDTGCETDYDTGLDVGLSDRDAATDTDDAEVTEPQTTLTPLPEGCDETVDEPLVELEELWWGGIAVGGPRVHVWSSREEVETFVAETPGLEDDDVIMAAVEARDLDFATQRWVWVVESSGTLSDHRPRLEYPTGVYAQDDGFGVRLVFQHFYPGCGTVANGAFSTYIYDAVIPAAGEVVDCTQLLTSCEE